MTFGAPGTYVLRLTATDGELTASDDVEIVANPGNEPPRVSAGLDGPVTTAVLTLAGQVSDDGLPAGGTLGSLWSLVSGPGPVIFTNAASPTTAVRFEADGVFTLRLSATDGELHGRDDVTFTVARVNQAPAVEAGASQAVTLPAQLRVTRRLGERRRPAHAGAARLPLDRGERPRHGPLRRQPLGGDDRVLRRPGRLRAAAHGERRRAVRLRHADRRGEPRDGRGRCAVRLDRLARWRRADQRAHGRRRHGHEQRPLRCGSWSTGCGAKATGRPSPRARRRPRTPSSASSIRRCC